MGQECLSLCPYWMGAGMVPCQTMHTFHCLGLAPPDPTDQCKKKGLAHCCVGSLLSASLSPSLTFCPPSLLPCTQSASVSCATCPQRRSKKKTLSSQQLPKTDSSRPPLYDPNIIDFVSAEEHNARFNSDISSDNTSDRFSEPTPDLCSEDPFSDASGLSDSPENDD